MIINNQHHKEKNNKIKEKILAAARDIIAKEGIQGLSIRKITRAIDYSPAIVYHYFKNKNEIIKIILREEYQEIVKSVESVSRDEDEPEKEIKEAFTNYIEAALDNSDIYKAFMLNSDPNILKQTTLLKRGSIKTSPALQLLCDNIRRGLQKNHYKSLDPELTSQIIWTSVFGLIIKLIIEKDVSEKQVERLIDQQFDILFRGILKKD